MDLRPVIVMTGATNGMGRLAALDLARRGARLGVVARGRPKAVPSPSGSLRRDTPR
ncbi:hypothetical protein [Streptomyces olivochromogenes]|uniref:Short-chain dehydrogenase n=1 Tax=Streptomyces olivochromogenes TaxID=1963 RepID=A0A250VLB8_STROL|nr:hypothetical protein [Streptomyces olivochromogenes]GAX54852.1 hypothetical protein SO3561_06405 [Streptomyces olivochromogenes]